MPHAGLMDPDALGPEKESLQQARLHIRGGKRRLGQGKISAGIITLYDALLAAMDWYVADAQRKNALSLRADDNVRDDTTLYLVLVRSGVLDGSFDYDEFDRIVDQAAYNEMPDFDYTGMLAGIEKVMTQLGVMPFDEKALPPEDPRTF